MAALLAAAAIAATALSLLTPAAQANVPVSVTQTNTVRVPSLANTADGTLTTKLNYTDRTATATTSTGNTVWLGKGAYFKLTTCVAYHLQGHAPVSSCARRYVDTRTNTATVYTYAPAVTLTGQTRPSASPTWGYFSAYAEVAYQTGTSFTLLSHSWPDSGIQGAGLPVDAQGATSAALPATQPVPIDGPYTGQINSGQPDDICAAEPAASNGSPLPAGVHTSDPAFTGAPAYYEVGAPSGAFTGQAPRGTVLVIHGGGWSINGVGSVQASRGEADRWRARGYQTVNFTYRACGQSLADVAWFYDKTRAASGPTAKICATGVSAGGNLALLLAVNRPGVYCVVSEAGPTDLSTIQSQLAYDVYTGTLNQTNGGRWVHNLGVAAFGGENLTRFSPAALATGSLTTTRVLQGFSADDALIPWQQATELRDAMLAANPSAYNDADRLAKGTVPFGHGAVTQAALNDFYARELQLISPST
jgi:acetyl esterase/lipase